MSGQKDNQGLSPLLPRGNLQLCVSCCSSYSPPPPRPLLSAAAVVDVDVDDVDVDVADDVDFDVDDAVPPIHHLHPDLSSSAAVFALIENCS